MEIRILGRDLEVSEIGFGCMGMSHAYGTVSTQKEADIKCQDRMYKKYYIKMYN